MRLLSCLAVFVFVLGAVPAPAQEGRAAPLPKQPEATQDTETAKKPVRHTRRAARQHTASESDDDADKKPARRAARTHTASRHAAKSKVKLPVASQVPMPQPSPSRAVTDKPAPIKSASIEPAPAKPAEKNPRTRNRKPAKPARRPPHLCRYRLPHQAGRRISPPPPNRHRSRCRPPSPRSTKSEPEPEALAGIPPAQRLKIRSALLWAGDYPAAASEGDPLQTAIKNFQKRHKAKVTGVLTSSERADLVDAADRHERNSAGAW